MKQLLFFTLAIAAMLLGGMGVLHESSILQRAYASGAWPVAQGVFQTVQVKVSKSRTTRVKWLAVHYTYEVNGVSYSSQSLWPPGTHSGMSDFEVDRLALQWKPGAAVLVSYDPADHAASAVIPGLFPGMIGNLLIGLAVLVGGAVMLLLDRPRRIKPRPATS